MPGPSLRLLLLLSLAAAAPTSAPRPAEPRPAPAAAPGQVKENQTKSVMTKKSYPAKLLLQSSEEAGPQKDHLTYKCFRKKEKFGILKNGREFDLKSETRASTYKNKKLPFRNIVLKLPLFQGKQANNGIRKAILSQRWLGRKKISSTLTKIRVLALVRKTSMEKQNTMKAELQEELKNALSKKGRLSTESPFLFARAHVNWVTRKWWWLKVAFLKAPPNEQYPENILASSIRNNQIRGNQENSFKSLKKDPLSNRPLVLMRTVQQIIRTWKLYNLSMVYKDPCKSVNSKSALSVDGKEEPEKDEIVLKTLRGRQWSLNISANNSRTWKIQSRKISFGHYRKMGKGSFLTSLTSMKTKSMIIQKTQGVGNRVISSVIECIYSRNDSSKDPCRKQNSTDSGDVTQVLSRNEGQETKSSPSEFIQEKLKFLSAFTMTSKDRKYGVKIRSVYIKVPLILHESNTDTVQRKIGRLVGQDKNPTDPRVSRKKTEVDPGTPELEGEGKASQWRRSEEDGEKLSWNKAQPPSTDLLHSWLHPFIIRPHFNKTVMSQGKLTTFTEIFMVQLPRKSQPALDKLTVVLTALQAAVSPKSSSFPLEPQQVKFFSNMGEMRRLILNLWKTKQTFPSVFSADLKLRRKKLVESNEYNVNVTNQHQKLLHGRNHLSSDFLYFPGFASSSELIKRQKRDVVQADGNVGTVRLSVDFLNHLSYLLGIAVSVVAMAFLALLLAICILFYKQRELLQVSKVSLVVPECQEKSFCPINDSCLHGISLSRCFHSSVFQQDSRDKEFELQEVPEKHEQKDFNFVLTSITSDSSDMSSGGKNTNLVQSSSSASPSDSIYSQSIEASGEWFSEEDSFQCLSSTKEDLTDRVQVYLETTPKPPKPQDKVTVSEDQKYLSLDKVNRKKMPVSRSFSLPSKVSSDTLYQLQPRDNPFKVSAGIPCPPQPCSKGSKASPGLKASGSKASPGLKASSGLKVSGSKASPGLKASGSKASPGLKACSGLKASGSKVSSDLRASPGLKASSGSKTSSDSLFLQQPASTKMYVPICKPR